MIEDNKDVIAFTGDDLIAIAKADPEFASGHLKVAIVPSQPESTVSGIIEELKTGTKAWLWLSKIEIDYLRRHGVYMIIGL